MWQTNIKIAIRSFLKEKTFGGLNLLGLTIGMLGFLVILQFVRYEWNYDQQSPHAEHIYRVYCETKPETGSVTSDANTHSAIGPALQRDLPEVVEYTRLYNHNEDEVVVLRENQPQKISGAWYVDPGYLRMFRPNFIAGKAATALQAPYSVVITESIAEKLFGEVKVIGQTIDIPAGIFQGTYTIRGVVEDPPPNTHLKFNFLASYSTRYSKGHEDNWHNYWEYTYFQVSPDSELANVKDQLTHYSQTHLADDGLTLHLQALTDIHLHSALTYEIEPNGNARMVNFLGLIAIFLLLIAFFNYVNMMTAKALRRAKEVGLRKVVGASRGQLIWQFLIEGALLNLAALGIALILLPPSLEWFGQFTNRPLGATFSYDTNLGFIVAGVFIASLLMACLYPALVLSAYRPVRVLKGYFARSRKGQNLRKGLVVFQFTCSTMLIIAVGIVDRQLQFLRNHELGLQLEQILAIQTPELDYRNDSTSFSRFNTFSSEVRQLPGVKAMTVSNVVPGIGISTISGGSAGLHRVDQPETSIRGAVYYLDIAPNFFDTYDIPFLVGQTYPVSDRRSLFNNVILNESACRLLGYTSPEEALNQSFAFDRSPDRAVTIRGVVADFHIEGLQEPTRPTLYHLNPRITNGYFSLKIAPREIESTLTGLQNTWAELFPLNPFEYWFVDEHFQQQYANERVLAKSFTLFASLAIFIACLGLFGLATYTAQQRSKEIGIRKILGAGVYTIISLLSKEFLQLVLIALIIATPIAWFLMERWLEDFAHRITIQWRLLLLAGIISVGIAFITISWKSWRAAIANPVDSLRDE